MAGALPVTIGPDGSSKVLTPGLAEPIVRTAFNQDFATLGPDGETLGTALDLQGKVISTAKVSPMKMPMNFN